jgi:hypothetical protein
VGKKKVNMSQAPQARLAKKTNEEEKPIRFGSSIWQIERVENEHIKRRERERERGGGR